jgi:hypothetical protein
MLAGYFFAYCGSMRSLCVPASVTEMGLFCFQDCEALAIVTFEQPSRLSVFGPMVFSGCLSLHTVCIPASTTVIGRQCFDGCCCLSVLTFAPESKLSRIDEYAFAGCSALHQFCLPPSVEFLTGLSLYGVAASVFTIDRNNRFFQFRDDFLTDIHGTSLIRYFGDGADIVVGRHVEQVSAGCFAECSSISQVRFESVCQISVLNEAVFYRSSLQSILIPCSITTRGQDCFAQCQTLSTVAFESGCQVSIFGPSAFSRSSLPSIVIPSSVQTIQRNCFYSCDQLSTVEFEAGSRLALIENDAFALCDALESICLPSSVLTVSESCFRNCPKLADAPRPTRRDPPRGGV